MKPTIFFLINSIDIKRGGLTRASLKQASLFAEMGFKTYMITFNFNPNYPYIRKQLKDMNRVHKDVIIRNMYEELAGHRKPPVKSVPKKTKTLDYWTEGHPHDKRGGHHAYRVYKNGVYDKYINFDENGFVNFIDYFNENRYRTKRLDYDLWGNVRKASYMDFTYNSPRQLVYYNDEGKAYFTQWNNPETNDAERIILFNHDGSFKKAYVNDDVSHKVDWLSSIISQEKNRAVVVSDTRSTDEVLINLNHPKAAKIWRLHSNHVKAPYQLDSDIAPAVQTGFNHMNEFDAAVVLTHEQKQDIIERTHTPANLKVIPHYHETNDNILKTLFERRKVDQKTAVIVSRLSTLKRIDHAIKAFKIVTDKIPDARLEIWGEGTQKGNLKKIIKKLGLQKNVFLKGYTLSPDEIYKKGLFSMLTSKSEGFALSVLESMYNQTPVISYNVRYGPTDMIKDQQNGLLVENGDIEGLAKKMIYLFENPKKALDMGKKANQSINKHFSKKHYQKCWLDVIDSAMKQKFKS